MSEITDEKMPVSSRPVADPALARRELVRALVICFVAVIFVRSFVFELFKIPSSSMVPTLRIGDHIVVSKFNYGLTFPFTAWEFVNWGTPKRGDVIVFIYPKDESLYYIKRVIGLPGDKIDFKGKELSVNGQIVPKEIVSDENEVRSVLGADDAAPGQLYRETIDGVSHYVKYSNSSAFDYSKNPESYQVQADQFFVMGDNRDDSYDSRSWGNVPRHNVRGQAQLIWISLDRNAGWSSSDKVRWNRSMQIIH